MYVYCLVCGVFDAIWLVESLTSDLTVFDPDNVRMLCVLWDINMLGANNNSASRGHLQDFRDWGLLFHSSKLEMEET